MASRFSCNLLLLQFLDASTGRKAGSTIPRRNFPVCNHTSSQSSTLTKRTIMTRSVTTVGVRCRSEKQEDSRTVTRDPEMKLPSSKLVLVIGGSGGVGQLVVASLVDRGIKTHLLLRDPSKAEPLFGKQDKSMLKVWKGDTRNPSDLRPDMFEESCFLGRHACNLLHWDNCFSF